MTAAGAAMCLIMLFPYRRRIQFQAIDWTLAQLFQFRPAGAA
jgi:hypothetical protein